MNESLFDYARQPNGEKAKAAELRPEAKSKAGGWPHRCFRCGGFAPFGRGDARRPESIIWACRDHRRELCA